MWASAIGRLRLIGLVEGVSYLVLLFIAMPLKYLAGYPLAVKVVGWAHGALFVAFCLALAQVFFQHRWPLLKGIKAFIASLVPLGTFFLDRSLKEEDAQAHDRPA
ncbi:MAG: DUF3817 domain-containing protein [Deltaproteobacteria bacterium]|jgi:integral membrane protein|nr:DUF3817 domain-containing protein [Deltaproteobacteria bacterium]